MTTSIMTVTNQIRVTNKIVKPDQEYLCLCQYGLGVLELLSPLNRIQGHWGKENQELKFSAVK